MKFFLPHAKDEAEAESVYDGIKKFLLQELGADCSPRRVRLLEYVHEGKTYRAEVGQDHSLNKEPVIAILYEPMRRLYHVCTPNRGVIRGGSILVGESSVHHVEDFD